MRTTAPRRHHRRKDDAASASAVSAPLRERADRRPEVEQDAKVEAALFCVVLCCMVDYILIILYLFSFGELVSLLFVC